MDLNIVLIFLLALFCFFLFGWLALVELRHRRLAGSMRLLMTGRGGADLESILMDFVARMDRVEQATGSLSQRTIRLEQNEPYLVQHVGIVRFNPFADKGGDQSFAIAILDDHTDGVVISCLHSRVDNKIYAKPVVGGQSSYNLTDEERQAIARAMKPRA